jgi:hypothetical protein
LPKLGGAQEARNVQIAVFFFGGKVFQAGENALLARRLFAFLLLFCCGRPLKQVKDEIRAHRSETRILLVNDGIGDIQFESLQTELQY